MKSVRALIIASVVVALLFSVSFGSKVAVANPDYNIDRVDHTVKVLYNGYLLINDTITTSVPPSGSFFIGFPYKYGSQLLRSVAYKASDRSTVYPVTLNVPLENRVGFYGVRVDMPDDAPQTFTVETVLSNSLLTQDAQNSTIFTLDFPAYPSLTKPAALCSGLLQLPSAATYVGGTVSAFNYNTTNLAALSYNVSKVTFMLTDNEVQLFEIKELDRDLTIDAFGEIGVTDSYYIINDSPYLISIFDVAMPQNTSVPTFQDQFGRPMSPPLLIGSNPRSFRINLTLPIEPTKPSRFTVVYSLDKDAYSMPQDEANKFAYDVTMFNEITCYIDQAFVSINLPEGAKLLGNPVAGFYSVGKSIFSDTATIQKQGLTSLDGFQIEVVYGYNSLWMAFRPTMWVWSVALIGCAVFIVWKRPRAPVQIAVPSATMRLRPENIKSFIESYEEKMRILREMDALEARVQRGKIPRRRYKVQKITLEMRLNTLSRELTEVREAMRQSGGHHADLMRQLEVAETEINDVEANVKTIDARQGRGEVSIEAYRKLMGDYQRKKERAETAINGILLRLREEAR